MRGGLVDGVIIRKYGLGEVDLDKPRNLLDYVLVDELLGNFVAGHNKQRYDRAVGSAQKLIDKNFSKKLVLFVATGCVLFKKSKIVIYQNVL